MCNRGGRGVRNIDDHKSVIAVSYGDIASGEITDYKAFEIAVEFVAIRLSIEGEVFLLQRTDGLGTELLGTGEFTYLLGFDPEARALNLTTRADNQD